MVSWRELGAEFSHLHCVELHLGLTCERCTHPPLFQKFFHCCLCNSICCSGRSRHGLVFKRSNYVVILNISDTHASIIESFVQPFIESKLLGEIVFEHYELVHLESVENTASICELLIKVGWGDRNESTKRCAQASHAVFELDSTLTNECWRLNILSVSNETRCSTLCTI